MAANRTVRTTLVAQVSGYLNGMDQAARSTRELGSETERLGQHREAFEGLGRGAIAFGAVALASVGLAVAKYAEFDQAMSGVQAATHASAGEMGQLREAAIQAGATSVFTATEAANAIEELSKAGVSTADILGGGLNGALDLASAGELKVADAAAIAATAMTQFKLKGDQVPHLADLLAAGAGKAQGSVEDLAAALNQGGLVASQAGFSIEETTGTLAAFASAGLLGSDAGTSLKTAIIALQNPSTQSAAVMRQYGIDIYDSSGKMLSFGGIAQVLQNKLGGLTDEQRNSALAQIFGNDAVRAANVLYAEGADGIAEWTTKVNDQGYAAETARLKLDNLKGDIEKLGGSFDTALIKTGSGANDVLRSLTQSATFLVDAIGEVPAPLLAAGIATTALVGGFALLGGGAMVAIPKFAAFRAQLDTMGVSLRTAAIRTAATTGAVAGVTLAIGYYVSQAAQAKANTEELTATLDQSTGAMTKNTRAAVARQLAEAGAFDAAKEAGITQAELTDAVLKGGDAYDTVRGKLDASNTVLTAFTGEAFRVGAATDKIVGLRQSVVDSQGAFENQEAANANAGETAQTTAEQYKAEADRVADVSQELSQLLKQLNDTNNANQDAVTTNAAYQEALAGLKDQVDQQKESTKDWTNSLDENTAVGSGNASMLSDIASKAQAAAEKQYQVDQTTMSAKDAADKYAATLATQRQKFEDAAVAAGFNRDQVRALGDQVFALPSAKQIEVLANTAAAAQKISSVRDLIAQVQDKNVYIGAHVDSTQIDSLLAKIRSARSEMSDLNGSAPGNGRMGTSATGGPVVGPGTGTSDDVPMWLSNGEYVVRTASVNKYGMALLSQINAGTWDPRTAAMGRMATGGPVAYQPTVYQPTPPQVIYAQQAASVASAPRIGRVSQTIIAADPVAAGMSVVRRLNALGA